MSETEVELLRKENEMLKHPQRSSVEVVFERYYPFAQSSYI